MLIDGHSIAYRAFFALPVENFSTQTGQHTNGVFGFTSMLINVLRDEKPTHLGVAFDVSRHTFRSEIYSEYKANRTTTPDEFRGQLDLVKEVLKALNISYLEKEGFEADDVIGTLATRAEAAGYDVLICTGDRDIFQLVSDNVTVLYPRKGVSDLARMTPQAVEERYFATPKRYPELAALVGESSDNLPGVPGVGPKTAAKWLEMYDGLENLAAHASVETVIENGADGVGLFRIEELYFTRELPPSEEELFSELQYLVAPLREKPVTIRLLDIGGDKAIPSLRLPFQSNPLLGKRGVRVLLDYPQLARAQLKSLLRLSQTQDIRILVPMVTFERDMQQMRELLVAVAREMDIQKLPLLGAMIETPAAALTVGQIARHADFLSVGTNDLTQYTLVAGRDNAAVSGYYEDTHPSMLRLLRIIIAEASGKPVAMCGEMAGREDVIPTLDDCR